MWVSFKEYITALGHWGWFVLGDVVSGGAGAYLDVSGRVGFPTFIWILMLLGGLTVAPFMAFHKVRLQRDEAVKSDSSIATRIISVSSYSHSFLTTENEVIFSFEPEIHAIPAVRVEDILVEIRGERYPTNWQPMNEAISGDIGHHITAKLPKSLKAGVYQARIIAMMENKERPSEPFDVRYPTPTLDKGVSQT
jgi:hypothetical protein